ncbi:MAG: tetratricopeptide repeat protein [Deltaproteobacteria bacterium]|nr:tetratricopeptide repeat protein [Deltaproteobacteria bacterium]
MHDEAADEHGARPPRPEVELFSARAVGWCTFFFSPLVGGLMAAANHRRLGDQGKARGTAALALGAIVAFVLLGYFVDSAAVNGAVGGGTGTLAWSWYKEQKPLVAAHLGAGGRLARPWLPMLAGAGLIALTGLSIYLELNSTSNTAFQAGVVAAQAEDWPSAEARFREVLAEDASRDDARFNLGLSLMNQGKNRAARREFGRVQDDSEVAVDAHRLRLQLSP